MENKTAESCRNVEIGEMRRAARMQKWKEDLEDQQSSGLPIDAWCRANGLSPSAFYRRLRKLRDAVCDEMNRRQLPARSVQSAVPVASLHGHTGEIHIAASGLEITVGEGVSPEIIRTVIQSLKTC